MKLLDVNILVQAHREDADKHREIIEWLEEQLSEPQGVAVSDLVLSGFLRVVTHPRIFNVPSPLGVAMEFIEDFRSHGGVSVISPGQGHWDIFRNLCEKSDARGNLVPDAYQAALAIQTGCEWVSLDRGFSRYPGLRWIHPLDGR